MKCLVFLSLLFLADVVLSSPIPTDNLRWAMVPDPSGKLHLVDLEAYEEPVEPQFVPAQDVFFVLHTRSNPTVGQRIDFTMASITQSNFNAAHPTKFSVHGWQSDSTTFTNTVLRDAFLAIGDFNIITVDWGVGAGNINYITSRNNVPLGGAHVATYVDWLHLNNLIRFNDLELIGISLGGQLIGHVGKFVQRGRIGYICSLDPAGPLFHYDRPTERIDSSDAEYVEVIYTNAGLLGFDMPTGHANFWPNYGSSQPGCITDLTGTCSHTRSVTLHAESISSTFTGHQCQSFEQIQNENCVRTGVTARMGGPLHVATTRGNFYLTTHGSAPFSMG